MQYVSFVRRNVASAVRSRRPPKVVSPGKAHLTVFCGIIFSRRSGHRLQLSVIVDSLPHCPFCATQKRHSRLPCALHFKETNRLQSLCFKMVCHLPGPSFSYPVFFRSPFIIISILVTTCIYRVSQNKVAILKLLTIILLRLNLVCPKFRTFDPHVSTNFDRYNSMFIVLRVSIVFILPSFE